MPSTEIGLIEMPAWSRSTPPRARSHSVSSRGVLGADLVLDPCVQILGRLANDHEIYVLVP